MVVFGTSVSKWFVIAALIALLWVARGVLPPFIVAGIFAYVLSPLVDELAERSRIRRAWVALGVFGVVVLLFGGLVWLAGARASFELRLLQREGPSIIESVVNGITGGQNIELFGQSVTSAELGRRVNMSIADALGTPSQAIQAISAALQTLLAVILVFLSLAYMLVDGHNFFRYVLRFVP